MRTVAHSPADRTTELRAAETVTRGNKFLLWILLAVLCIPVLLLLGSTVYAFALKSDVTYPESAVGYNALAAVRTGHLYRPMSEAPYTPSPYGPLFYFTLACIAKIGGLGIYGVRMAGRLLSFAAFLGVTAIIYRYARFLGTSVVIALVAAAMFMGSSTGYLWNATARPDFLALFFALLGLFVVITRDERLRWGVLAGLCFAAALLMKQSFMAAPVAAAIWSLNERRFRSAWTFVTTAAVVVAGIVLILQWRGDVALANLFMLRHSETELLGAYSIAYYTLILPTTNTVVLLCSAVGLAVSYLQGPRASRAIIAYAVLAWGAGLMQLLHIGSATNALIEVFAVSSIMAAVGISWMWQRSPRWIVAITVLSAICMAAPATGALADFHHAKEQVHDCLECEKLVRGRTVLTDNPYYSVLSNEPVMLDSYFNTLLERDGTWSSDEIVRRLTTKHFDIVLLTIQGRFFRTYRFVPYFSPKILRTLGATYTRHCQAPLVPGVSKLAVWLPIGVDVSPEMQKELDDMNCR